MKIEAYSKAKHWEIIKDILENDKEWKALIWEIWLYEPLDDCSFWHYRTVLLKEDQIIWFCFFGGTYSLTNTTTLKQLYIKDWFRKEGWWSKLIKDWEEYYNEVWVDYIKITAISSNKKAINFYKKLWYSECGYEERSIKYKWKLSKAIFFDKLIK